jgi:hypothetical protein
MKITNITIKCDNSGYAIFDDNSENTFDDFHVSKNGSVLNVTLDGTPYAVVDADTMTINESDFTGQTAIFNELLARYEGECNETVEPPAEDVCYVFSFDMSDPGDLIESIRWDNAGNTEDIFCGINLGLGPGVDDNFVRDDIMDTLDGNDPVITYEDVTVVSSDLGGGLRHYTVTIKNPSVVFTALALTNSTYGVTTTDCT